VADRTPAETAALDQNYARMSDGLTVLVNESRGALDDLGPAEAAQLLAASIGSRGYKVCTLASYLAVAIIRLQRLDDASTEERRTVAADVLAAVQGTLPEDTSEEEQHRVLTAVVAALRAMADIVDAGPMVPLRPSVFSALIREQADDVEAARG
jgi:hypothetical protein